jgi:hypothetical protein
MIDAAEGAVGDLVPVMTHGGLVGGE